MMLIIAASTNKTALTMVNGLVVFFYTYVALDIDKQTTVSPTMGIFALLAIIVTTYYTNKIGRKRFFRASSILAFTFGPIAILMVGLSTSPTPYFILVIMFGMFAFFNSATELNIIPMIGDTAVYE